MFAVNKKKKPFLLIGLAITLSLGVSLFFIRERLFYKPSEVLSLAVHSETAYSLPFDVIQYLLALSPEERKDLARLSLPPLEERMKQCPVIAKCRLRKLFPDTLVVDYALKSPIFQLGNGQNLLIDVHGDLFRKSPYFPSLSLPKLLFPHSETPMSLALSIKENKDLFDTCVDISQQLQEMALSVLEIDAEDAVALGYFRREIRVQTTTCFLRLPIVDTDKALRRVPLLLSQFEKYSGVIDLRFPDVAYLE